jgi:hypothetical protein
MIGSFLFALGSVPGYASLVPTSVVGVTYFVGSIFFTSAGFLQLMQSIGPVVAATEAGRARVVAALRDADFWASAIQSTGTIWFNINTYNAMQEGLTTREQNLRIWTPDFFGSICFLVASWLAVTVVCHKPWCVERDNAEWWMAGLNLLGSAFFMISAIAAFVVPDTGDLLDASLANSNTMLGALCFFWAAWIDVTRPRAVVEVAE